MSVAAAAATAPPAEFLQKRMSVRKHSNKATQKILATVASEKASVLAETAFAREQNMPDFDEAEKEETATGRRAGSLGLFAKRLIQVGKTRGMFTVGGMAEEWQIRKRRFYDCTDILMEMGLVTRDWATKTFTWIGLEGMETACTRVFGQETESLLENMFDPVGCTVSSSGSKILGSNQNLLRRVTRFLMNFYMHGYFVPKKHLKSAETAGARIEQFIENNGLTKEYAKYMAGSAGRTAFRRLYDVLNVFDSCEFYVCADRVVDQMASGTRAEKEEEEPKFPETPLRRSTRLANPPSFVTVSNVAVSSVSVITEPSLVCEHRSDGLVDGDNSSNWSSDIGLFTGVPELAELFYTSHSDAFFYSDATIPF